MIKEVRRTEALACGCVEEKVTRTIENGTYLISRTTLSKCKKHETVSDRRNNRPSIHDIVEHYNECECGGKHPGGYYMEDSELKYTE